MIIFRFHLNSTWTTGLEQINWYIRRNNNILNKYTIIERIIDDNNNTHSRYDKDYKNIRKHKQNTDDRIMMFIWLKTDYIISTWNSKDTFDWLNDNNR